MKPPLLIFLTLIIMACILSIVLCIEEQPYEDVTQEGVVTRSYLGHGTPHPEQPAMQRGGDGAARSTAILNYGLALALVHVVFVIACLALGMTKKGKLGPLLVPLLGLGVGFGLLFVMVFFTYHGYINEEEHRLFLSFPIPSAWMVYTIWSFPLLFAGLFYLKFDTWYATPKDLERFHEIVAERRRIGGGSA
jgi:hypothetical protein